MENTHNEKFLTNPSGRYVYLDVLRLLAIFCVIFNHSGTGGYFLYTTTDNVVFQAISIFVSSYIKIGVPLFFMISGALLLKKDESYGKVLKRVLRFVAILFIFCALRYLYEMRINDTSPDFIEMLRRTTTGQMFTSYWFLYNYIGFLLMTPILRKIARALSDSDYWYLLGLYIFTWGILGILARTVLGQMSFSIGLAADTIVYPLLGYFFANRFPQKWSNRRTLWFLQIAGIIGLVLNVSVVMYDYYTFKGWTEAGISLFIILPAIATFSGAKYILEQISIKPIWKKIICTLGSCTFGVYLLECYIKDFFGPYLQKIVRFLPYLLENLTYMVLIILVGCLVTFLLKKIPVIRKLF